ncbi:hypothetical protein GDO78_020286 [Eleutherodactylus coqui]|uniref:Uncharacterized protein n=1 Tax=Eleutherodactylus coqui TaxID=57060 RepID=A0A8J6BII7_ELECQ|nr:hypothetical protein GDO78_020286 [Eleutherodactylus coqui]
MHALSLSPQYNFINTSVMYIWSVLSASITALALPVTPLHCGTRLHMDISPQSYMYCIITQTVTDTLYVIR